VHSSISDSILISAVTTKAGTQFTTLDIGITDQSSLATLSLSQPLFNSAKLWLKNTTVLLISFPNLRSTHRLSATSRSHIDIDPDILEATTLRKYVQRESCPINHIFPEDVFDIEALETSPMRLQFTFQSLSQFIAVGEEQVITGYISVILSQVNLMVLFVRRQVFSMECCGMPVYANTTRGRCGQCGNMVHLRVNPNLIGGMADETGGVGCAFAPIDASQTGKKKAHSKVLWTDEAWCQLLGRSVEELAAFCREHVTVKAKKENGNLLRYLEQRLLWMRVVLMVGWTGCVGGGRLAVLRVVA
jgi:hypothetical protein